MKHLILFLIACSTQLSIAIDLGTKVENLVVEEIQRKVVSAELWLGPFSEKEMFIPTKKIKLRPETVDGINKAAKTLVWKDAFVVVTRDAVDYAIMLTYKDGDCVGLWLGSRSPSGYFSVFFGEQEPPVATGLLELQLMRERNQKKGLVERQLTWDWASLPRHGEIYAIINR